MSMALVRFGLIVSRAKPSAVVLSVHSGVAGCGCFISSSVTCIGHPVCAFTKRPPVSDSAADDMMRRKQALLPTAPS